MCPVIMHFFKENWDYILEIPDPTGDIDIEHSISNFSYCKLMFVIRANYIFTHLLNTYYIQVQATQRKFSKQSPRHIVCKLEHSMKIINMSTLWKMRSTK